MSQSSRRGNDRFYANQQRPPNIMAANGDILGFDNSRGAYEPIYVQLKTKKKGSGGSSSTSRALRRRKDPRTNGIIVIDLGYRSLKRDAGNVTAEKLRHAGGDIDELPLSVKNMYDAAKYSLSRSYTSTSTSRAEDRTRHGKWARLYNRAAYVATYDPDLSQSKVFRMTLVKTGLRDQEGNTLFRLSNPTLYRTLYNIHSLNEFLQTEMVRYVVERQRRISAQRRQDSSTGISNDEESEHRRDEEEEDDDDYDQQGDEDDSYYDQSYGSPVHSEYGEFGFARVTI